MLYETRLWLKLLAQTNNSTYRKRKILTNTGSNDNTTTTTKYNANYTVLDGTEDDCCERFSIQMQHKRSGRSSLAGPSYMYIASNFSLHASGTIN